MDQMDAPQVPFSENMDFHDISVINATKEELLREEDIQY